jgi:hypothetical protein
VRHYVLTRSAYGPEWDIDANRRRLDITRAVTARLMAAQTDREWTWIVLVDSRDPLLAERRAVYELAAPRCIVLPWVPAVDPQPAAWDRHGAETNTIQRIAADAYRAPWALAVGPRDDVLLQTRLDDDDGLAVDALERISRHATRDRAILMHPAGVRVWHGRYSDVRHERNAMHTLVTPPGDPLGVYEYGHMKVSTVAPVVTVDTQWAWLWVRHSDTISGWKKADHPITPAVRDAFPVDWAALGRAWA